MSAAPLVSVIIPCHNAEATLRETLESVLSQEGIVFEVIALDDASTDGTAALLRNYANRIRAVSVQLKDAGATRNAGLVLAVGQYVQFVDSDDLLLPGTLARRAHALQESGGDIAYCDWSKLEQRGDGRYVAGEVISRRIEDVHPRTEIATATDFWAPLAALLYRRDLLLRLGGFNTRLRVIEDARLLQDAANAGAHFTHLAEIGAHYRVPLHTNTRSRRNPSLFVLDCLQNIEEIEQHWRQRGALDAEQQRALAQVYRYCCNELFRLGEKTAFVRALSSLYEQEPGFAPTRAKIVGLLWPRMPHAAVTVFVRAFSLAGRVLGHRPA